MSETKICRCICCGREIEVTKFASPSKTKCEDCRVAKLEPNIDILNEIRQSSKSKSNNTSGNTKISKCIRCGKEVIVSKFASHDKTVCDDCKGGHVKTDVEIDLSKIDYDVSSPSSIYITPSIINNENLRSVTCPACHTPDMNIIKVNDCSPQWGLVITYQCKNDECMLLMNISEQTRTRIEPSSISTIFNYRGEEIKSVAATITDTRIRNIIDYMLLLLDEHNIPVDGIELPNIDDFKSMKTGINSNINGEDEQDEQDG